MAMRRPRDIKAELEALRAKEAELKAAHKEQLAELVERTGATRLDPDALAGVLLAAVEEAASSPEIVEAWRRRGEAFFRPERPRRGDQAGTPPRDLAGASAPAPGA